MDRESLRPLVEAQFGESRITVLSDETINAELDDALTGITDDAQADEAFCKRIAQRLLRMNGNVTKDASTQINDWKKKHPVQQNQQNQQNQQQQQNQQEENEDPQIKAMQAEIAEMKKSLAEKEAKLANDAVIAQVRSKLTDTFKEGGVQVKDYFMNQVFGKLELPELEEGKSHDIEALAKTAEENYFKELKAAGIKYEKPRKGGEGGGGGTDKAALAKREEFKARMRAKGKLPKEENK